MGLAVRALDVLRLFWA